MRLSLKVKLTEAYENNNNDSNKIIAHEVMWAWLRRGNFNRETESSLIATQYDKNKLCQSKN